MKFVERIPNFIRFGRFLWNWVETRPQHLSSVVANLNRFLWKWTKKLARPAFFALVCMVTLTALFIAEENYRTGREWENYKAAAEARGVKFTLAELVPPPVPDDQNFAMTPLLKPLFTHPDSPKNVSQWMDLPRDAYVDAPQDGYNWSTGKPSLSEWAAYFQKEDVMVALKMKEADLREISAAIQRPYLRFSQPNENMPKESEMYFRFLMSCTTQLIRLSRLYEMRASGELIAGKNAEALADVLTQLRLSQALRDYPFLISQLSEGMMANRWLQIVWEGLKGRNWTDAQLAKLQQEIQTIDFLRYLLQAEQGERATFCDYIEWLQQQDFATREKYFSDNGDNLPWSYQLELRMSRIVFTRALLAMNAYYDQYGQLAIDPAEARIHPDLLNAGADKFGANILVEHILPAFGRVIVQSAFTQTTLNEATVACALERYRLAHGDYPQKLDELVPQFITKLPHDLMTGGPLAYLHKSDGSLILSATGWNWTSGDGNPHHPRGIVRSSDNWIWQYSVK